MKFVPEMFGGDDRRGTKRGGLQGSDKQTACELAQAAFDSWLKEQRKVFCGAPHKGMGSVTEEWSIAEFEGEDTHTARLVDIREIET